VLRVGLTGGIACGKSTVGRMFSDLSAHLIEADTIAHELYRPGEPVYKELVEKFGPEIVRPDGEIDRARLAGLAFDGGRVDELNKIVHPAVIRRQEQWMHQVGAIDPSSWLHASPSRKWSVMPVEPASPSWRQGLRWSAAARRSLRMTRRSAAPTT
jgi:hypothetical protein